MGQETFLLLFLCLTTVEASPFRFANCYGNHMVLQMEPYQSIVWGFGELNSTVELEVKNKDGSISDKYTTIVHRGKLQWRFQRLK